MDYFCANCHGKTTLDVHGRCFRCQSVAVDIDIRPCVTAEGLASAYMIEVDTYDFMIEQEMERVHNNKESA
jgi:hypothetical protein